MNACWDCPHHRRELILTKNGRPLCFISWCCNAYQATTPPGVHRRYPDPPPLIDGELLNDRHPKNLIESD